MTGYVLADWSGTSLEEDGLLGDGYIDPSTLTGDDGTVDLDIKADQLQTLTGDATVVVPEAAPEACVLSPYSEWGACSLPCGGGTRSQYRTITNPSGSTGIACDGSGITDEPLSKTEPCNIGDCPLELPDPIKCTLSDWSEWGLCEEKLQTRARTVETNPNPTGVSCAEDLTETQDCVEDDNTMIYVGIAAAVAVVIMIIIAMSL